VVLVAVLVVAVVLSAQVYQVKGLLVLSALVATLVAVAEERVQ
jgi:hypothetical protein